MKFLVPFLAAFIVAGCSAKLPEETFQVNDVVMEKRQAQTKMVDREYDLLLSDSVDALQDMGFEVKSIDEGIGYIHATKSRELSTAFEAGAAELGINVAAALLGVQANYRHPQRLNVNAYLLLNEKGERCTLRTTFFNTTYDKRKGVMSYMAVDDQEIYQGFYGKVGKSSFLGDNLDD